MRKSVNSKGLRDNKTLVLICQTVLLELQLIRQSAYCINIYTYVCP